MTTDSAPRRERRIRGRWLVLGVVLILGAIGLAVFFGTAPSRAQSNAPRTVAVTRGAITATVDGSGTIAAQQTLDLGFQTSGTVNEILVKEGDTVTAGQPLARIDSRDLASRVASAQASLDSAKAQLSQTEGGNATPEEVAAQQASVRNAEAQLQKTKQGTSTAADVANAQANLRSAEAQLAALQNPSAAGVSTAERNVQQAENNVTSVRDSASTTKTNAEASLRQSTDALTKAQSAYATAASDWQYVQETGANPTTPNTTNSQGKQVKNKLNDTQRQQYYDTFVTAEASLRSAETDVQKAQVTYDQARQDEITKVRDAEQALADSQQQREALSNPDINAIAQAQASVDAARAQLDKTQQGGTKADVAAAQASVDQARSNLDALSAPQTESSIQIQQAAVAQAQEALTQAQLALENATLQAPFGGIVTTVNIVPGSVVGSGSAAALTLINRDPLHVDMSLSENDVAKVQASQPVSLTIDALPDWSATGVVEYIAPAATQTNGVVTYQVRVNFPDSEERVKVGMTANVSVETASKADVLFVPTSALLPKGTSQVVQVLNDAQQPTEVEVKTGISDGANTEIVSGLNEGQRIVATPSEDVQGGGGPFS